MRCLLSILVLLAGCQAGFDSKLAPPSQQTPYEWRYDPYTGQRIR